MRTQNILLLAVPLLFLGFTNTLAWGVENLTTPAKKCFYTAETVDSPVNTTDRLQGKYEVDRSSGEVFAVDGDKKTPVGGFQSSELLRLVGRDPANRGSVEKPLEIGKTGARRHPYLPH